MEGARSYYFEGATPEKLARALSNQADSDRQEKQETAEEDNNEEDEVSVKYVSPKIYVSDPAIAEEPILLHPEEVARHHVSPHFGGGSGLKRRLGYRIGRQGLSEVGGVFMFGEGCLE